MVAVTLYDGDKIIGTVKYNNLLDMWNGRNWQNGGVGRHKGFVKLKDGRYAIIYGSNWVGEKSYAKIVPKKDIIDEIIRIQDYKLLEKYPDLLETYKKEYIHEEDNDTKYFYLKIEKEDTKEDALKKVDALKDEVIKHFEEKSK